MIVLNVGGGHRILPPHYEGWIQDLLDIDPDVSPDICCDAKKIASLVAEGRYDAIYCSHNLEHFYQHDVPVVLGGFYHALKVGGFVEVRVPNINQLFLDIQAKHLDLMDVWYRVEGQPITFHDVLYGWHVAMKDGNLFYAHKCGFTAISLEAALIKANFTNVRVIENGMELLGIANKSEG